MFSSAIKKIQPVNTAGFLKYLGIRVVCRNIGEIGYLNPNNTAGQSDIAIYCIHGTCDNVSAFYYIMKNIKDALPKEICSVHVPAFTDRWHGQSIEYFAEELKNKILDNNHKNVILIGHSRGGIVASYFAEYLAAEINVNVLGVIAISAPFTGSKHAIWPLRWMSTSVDEMKINSDFLNKLNNRIRKSTKRYFYVAAKYDWLVPPESTALPEQKETIKILDDEGHLSMMLSPLLVDYIKDCIKECVPNRLTASLSCG